VTVAVAYLLQTPTVCFAMRDAAVDVDTGRMVTLVEELARVLGPHQGFRLGADGSVSVYAASPRVLLLAGPALGGQPNPSRLRPGHRPCPSRRRPPSSRGASAARSGCARST